MAVSLSYGLEKPQAPDKGSVFFPILEDWADWMQNHTHNGTNSEKISASGVNASSQSILAANWTVVTAGVKWKQTVSMPAGITFDNHIPSFRDPSGNICHLSVTKVTASTYDVFINDNSLTITVIYK
jgi:hypothetical protein